MTSDGWYEVGDDGSGRVWADPRLKTWDYKYADEAGWTSDESSLITPSGVTLPFKFHSGTFLWIEISEEVATALGEAPAYWRRLGFGRLRKDCTVPLMPEPERVWVQSVQDDAVLVMRQDEGSTPAFFLVGPLGEGARRMASVFETVEVVVAVGEGLLPNPTIRRLAAAADDRRAWGGQVACTAAG